METPASLLERLRRPDQEQAWARFVELYTPLLYHWARRTGCPESDAVDLVQEVITLLLAKLPEFSYDRRQSFRGWLRTVARNCWRNLRRKSQLPRQPGQHDLDELAGPQPDDPLAEAEYRSWLVGRALELMRADFAPSTWQACWQCVVDGRPAAEVARELGVRVGTVYASRSRVLSRLRQEMAGLWD
jgi:RNA polymerase sigma-70 factor, ECF subfamily